MSDFTKTLIVDSSITLNDPPGDPTYPSPPYFNTIKEATDYLISEEIGGVIVVEQGTYIIDGTNDPQTGDRRTVEVPSNVTIIGRGNAVIEITENISAFRNAGAFEDPQESNERITLSGFKIIVSYDDILLYRKHVVDFKGVNNCLIEKLYITYDQEQTYGVERNFSAISIWGNSDPEIFSRDNVIKQCSVVDFGKYSNIGQGNDNHYGAGIILHTKCERNKIYNNYLNSTAGVYCQNAEYTTVSNNVFSYGKIRTYIPPNSGGFGGAGICINTCHYTTFSGNQMNYNQSHGIYVGGSGSCTVIGNVCCYNYNQDRINYPKAGIKSNDSESLLITKFNTISGNSCYGNGHGICLEDYPSKNVIMGNNCCGNKYGIYLYDTTNYNLFVGNMCNPNIEHDIYLTENSYNNNFADNVGNIDDDIE